MDSGRKKTRASDGMIHTEIFEVGVVRLQSDGTIGLLSKNIQKK